MYEYSNNTGKLYANIYTHAIDGDREEANLLSKAPKWN